MDIMHEPVFRVWDCSATPPLIASVSAVLMNIQTILSDASRLWSDTQGQQINSSHPVPEIIHCIPAAATGLRKEDV